MGQIPHLKVVKTVMLINGLWPLKHPDKTVMTLFSFWSKFFYGFFLLCFASLLLYIPVSFGDHNALIENLSFSISYILIAVTVSYTNTDSVRAIVQEILDKEEYIIKYSNEAVKKIYFRYTSINTKINLYILSSTLLMMSGLYVAWIVAILDGSKGNLLFSVYLPFGVLDYFWVGFMYSTFQVINAGALYVYTKMLFISLIVSGVSSLKLLQHFLQYFMEYSRQYSKMEEVELEDAEYVYLKTCILEHKKIISYITAVKSATEKFVLVDFAAASVELCVTVLRMMVIKNREDFLTTILLFCLHLSHLTILYGIADSIQSESMKLGDYIYLHTNWYNQTRKFKIMMQMMILRSQKPLSLVIGPFGEMSNATLVAVLKAAFSYMTFFKTVIQSDDNMWQIPHLRVLKALMLFAGLWPLEHQDKMTLRLYKIYSKCFSGYFIINFLSLLANIPFSLKSGNDIIENLSFTITYMLILVTVLYTNSCKVKLILKQILERERHLVDHSNREVKNIYYSYTYYNTKVNLFFLGSTLLIMVGLMEAYITSIVNLGASVLYPVYLPFKVHKNLFVGFIYSSLQLIVAGTLYTYTKLLFISLIIFGVSSLKLLQHFLKYSQAYAKTYSDEKNIPLDESEYTLLRSCLLEHKNIISYVVAVRKATTQFMLINFCATSVELCVVLLRLIVIKNKEDYPATLLLLGMHLSHLTILYWNADLIRAESLKLGTYVYLYSGWQNHDKNFKLLTQMMMLRSQTPLSLAIGPFGEMSNMTLVNILKAAFSYLTFFRTMYAKK